MTKENAIKHATRFFENHPAVNTFFITANGKGFVEKSFAVTHAVSLEDKTVMRVDRDECAEGSADDKKANRIAAINAKLDKLKASKNELENKFAKEANGNKKGKIEGRVAVVNTEIAELETELSELN